MNLDWQAVLVALAGGAFGAALGAVPVFAITGVLVLIGVGIMSASGDASVIQKVAFGPFFGPHVSFGGAVAAAAYAARKGCCASGRDIGSGLMGLNDTGVLAIGAVFGAVGSLINESLIGIGAGSWTDTIALSVVLSAFLARVLFGKTSWLGTIPAGSSRYSPTEQANWLPWQQKLSQVAAIGAAVGALSGYMTVLLGVAKGGNLITFGISTTALVFLLMGNRIAVTHHIAITAGVAASLGAGLLTCAFVGVVSSLIAEGFSRTFHIYGDTHIDPPAGAIAISITLLRVADAFGLLWSHLP